MSNNEMVSVPRGLLAEAEAALRQTGLDVSLSADLRALLAEPAAQTQCEPVAWVTVYRRSGSKDRIEFGEENRERDITAMTWGVVRIAGVASFSSNRTVRTGCRSSDAEPSARTLTPQSDII